MEWLLDAVVLRVVGLGPGMVDVLHRQVELVGACHVAQLQQAQLGLEHLCFLCAHLTILPNLWGHSKSPSLSGRFSLGCYN